MTGVIKNVVWFLFEISRVFSLKAKIFISRAMVWIIFKYGMFFKEKYECLGSCNDTSGSSPGALVELRLQVFPVPDQSESFKRLKNLALYELPYLDLQHDEDFLNFGQLLTRSLVSHEIG